MQNIITLTINPAIDVNTSVDNFVPERKLRCSYPRREPGGGGINVSRAIKKLGGESTALYTSGGLSGKMLQELLDNEGLTHTPVTVSDSTRENVIVFEVSSALQYRLCMPGPKLKHDELNGCLDVISAIRPKPDYIVVSGSLPPDAPANYYAQVARIGNEMGSRVIVDTQGEPLRLAVDEGLFMVKPNLRELSQLTDCELKNEKEIEEAARKVVHDGKSKIVVISLGAGGALMVTDETVEYFKSPTVPIKSKVGAGDSMVGAIVLKLAQENCIKDAVAYGVAAGAAAVMTPGTELCRLEDTERLFREIR